jgi:hypothetical protein
MQCPIFIRKHRLTILGGLLGGIAGYLYYHFVGCSTGRCPITSSPYMSTGWGLLMGGLFLNIFEKKPIKKNPSDSGKTAE